MSLRWSAASRHHPLVSSEVEIRIFSPLAGILQYLQPFRHSSLFFRIFHFNLSFFEVNINDFLPSLLWSSDFPALNPINPCPGWCFILTPLTLLVFSYIFSHRILGVTPQLHLLPVNMCNAIVYCRESNPSRRICYLRAVPLCHAAN